MLKRHTRYFVATLAVLALMGTGAAGANEPTVQLKLSIGSTSQASNDVQIPNDDQGTRFDLADISGAGPYPAARLEGIWNINQKHGLRILLAPLSYSEPGGIDEAIDFAGARFEPGQPVQGDYLFNSWRIGYRYHMAARENWDFWVGGTLKVREAEIRLTQGDITSSDDNIGFVPLLYLAGKYKFNNSWALAADLDGLAGGPGRAIDLGIALEYSLRDQWSIGAEYRTLEGGADVEDVYNFAWFNSFVLTTQFGF